MSGKPPGPTAPEGFLPWPAKGPFTEALARMHVSGSRDAPVFGVRVQPVHCNGTGVAHGGFLSSLADVWSAYCLAPHLHSTAQFATSQLTVDFLSPAKPGDWLQSETDRVRVGRRLCVVTLAIVGDRRLIALARASFLLIEGRPSRRDLEQGQAPVLSESAAKVADPPLARG